MDSYLLTVEKALAEFIKSEVSNTYDISGTTFRGVDRITSKTGDYAVSILQAFDVDDISSKAGTSGSVRTDDKVYLIQGWARYTDFMNQTDEAHLLMAEVKKALAKLNIYDSGSYGLKGYNGSERQLIVEVDIPTGLVRPPDRDVSTSHGYFWLPIRVKLLEDIRDPYELP